MINYFNDFNNPREFLFIKNDFLETLVKFQTLKNFESIYKKYNKTLNKKDVKPNNNITRKNN